MRSFLALLLAVVALVALLSSPSPVSADPEFISGGDSAYVPGVSAVDWGNGHIEQPHISGWGGSSGGGSWGGRKSGGSSWTSTRTATPAKSSGGGWGKKRRSSEVSAAAAPAETEAKAAEQQQQKNPE